MLFLCSYPSDVASRLTALVNLDILTETYKFFGFGCAYGVLNRFSYIEQRRKPISGQIAKRDRNHFSASLSRYSVIQL